MTGRLLMCCVKCLLIVAPLIATVWHQKLSILVEGPDKFSRLNWLTLKSSTEDSFHMNSYAANSPHVQLDLIDLKVNRACWLLFIALLSYF